MRTVKSKSTEEAIRSVAYEVNKPKKRQARTRQTTPPSTNGFMTVSQFQLSKAPLIETAIDGHSLYLRPPSVYFMELIGPGDQDPVKQVIAVAEYLAENLFNDREGKNPVGTAEEFKKQFGFGELVTLFQKLNEGLVVKKKAK